MSRDSENPCGVLGGILSSTSTMLTTALTEVADVVHGRDYSPVTLRQDWSKIHRLLFLLFCSCYGSLMNGFFISSFFVEFPLRHVGNVFLTCAGAMDMVVTAGIIPVAAVIILSGQCEWDNLLLCKSLQFLGLTATYGYTIYFMFASVENYYRFCMPRSEYRNFLTTRIGLICIIIAAGSVVFAVAGVFYDLDIDYCERKHYGNFSYRIATTMVLQVVPVVITLYYLTTVFSEVKHRAKNNVQYKRSKTFEREYATSKMNLMAYWLHVFFWLPYSIIVYEFPNSSNDVFYNFAVIGLFRSVITSTIYAIFHLNFRQAYAHLFNYCCCKSSLSDGPISRHRRSGRSEPGPSEIRVHVMHRVISSSPQRAGPSTREVFAL